MWRMFDCKSQEMWLCWRARSVLISPFNWSKIYFWCFNLRRLFFWKVKISLASFTPYFYPPNIDYGSAVQSVTDSAHEGRSNLLQHLPHTHLKYSHQTHLAKSRRRKRFLVCIRKWRDDLLLQRCATDSARRVRKNATIRSVLTCRRSASPRATGLGTGTEEAAGAPPFLVPPWFSSQKHRAIRRKKAPPQRRCFAEPEILLLYVLLFRT